MIIKGQRSIVVRARALQKEWREIKAFTGNTQLKFDELNESAETLKTFAILETQNGRYFYYFPTHFLFKFLFQYIK